VSIDTLGTTFIIYDDRFTMDPLSTPADVPQEYECNICGKKFGDSLGDMERHILTEHMQTADFVD
jgi:hypothetical protein